MGGDNAPNMVLRGANIASKRLPNVRYLLYGDERRLKPLLERLPKLRERSEIRHTEDVVSNDVKPSVALRQGRQSSMRLAIEAVREGQLCLIEEDAAAVAILQELEDEEGPSPEVSTRLDTAALIARRMLARRLRAEAAAPASAR